MKIWLNTSHSPFRKEKDCSDCGDCAYAGSIIPSVSQMTEEDEVAFIRPLILKQATPLFIERYGEHWLLCNPTGSGRVTILDSQAMSLFTLYKVPLTLSQLKRFARDYSEADVVKVIALFYRTGLLQDAAAASELIAKENQEVLTAWLHVTNDCNMGCSYCYIHKTKEDQDPGIGRQAVEAVFRSARKHKFKQVKLKYAGGEASLHINEVLALHDYAFQLAQKYEIGLQGVLLTNGVALIPRTIEQLKVRQISVMISLDGLGSDHDRQRPLLSGRGSSRFVLRTIDRLLANGLVPFISVTISHMNLTGLPALIQYILDHELPFSLNYYRENDCSSGSEGLNFTHDELVSAMHSVFSVIEERLPARSLLDSLLDKVDLSNPHQRTCGVGQSYLVIDQQGGVAKCQMEIKQTITTVRAEDPLKLIKLDRWGVQGLPVQEKAECRSCEWRNWCTGGCPALTYRSTGRFDLKSPYCAIYKTLLPEVLRLEARRLLRYEEPLEVDICTSQSL